MKIIYDNIVYSLQRAGGISVVWSELLKRILHTEFVKTYFFEYCNDNIHRKEFFINSNSVLHELFSRPIALARYFDLRIKMNDKFIFHSSYYRISSNKRAINVTTIHDFTYEYYYNNEIRGWLHRWQKYRAIRKSDYIVCISNNTKSDLLKFVPNIDISKIRVIYNGVSDEYFPIKNKSEFSFPFGMMSYILFVGSREKYKKFDLAVEASLQSKKKLVIIGSSLSNAEYEFLIKRLGKSNFHLMGNISNDELNVIYNGAFCLMYPSEYEGFGIPIIEAQKAGCPVIAYRGSSIPEIIGDMSLLMIELTVDEILEKLSMLEDDFFRKKVICKGIENAKRFTWDKMYQEILSFYQEMWNK